MVGRGKKGSHKTSQEALVVAGPLDQGIAVEMEEACNELGGNFRNVFERTS